MEHSKCFKIAEDSFKKIQEFFPDLKMVIDYNHKYLELSMDIPKQNGLDFEINLNLQNNDELHISTSYIWCQLFSAESQNIVDDFLNAVQGLISGEYRIQQLIKANKVYRSMLQRPEKNQWKTIYTHYQKIKFPWIKLEENIIQNKIKSTYISIS